MNEEHGKKVEGSGLSAMENDAAEYHHSDSPSVPEPDRHADRSSHSGARKSPQKGQMGARKELSLVRHLLGMLLQPYYGLQLLVLFSYFALRHFAVPAIAIHNRPLFLRWEAQAGLSLGLVLVVKFVRSVTLEGFIADSLLYSKGVLVLLVTIIDPRVMAWYLFAFAAIFLLLHQPIYAGPEIVSDLTPLQLETQLSENRPVVWLVEFGAAWSSRCVQFRRVWSELSLSYSSQSLHFGRVDVGHFPSAASKYGIEFGVLRRQLPTLILFEGGVEIKRLPRVTADGSSYDGLPTKGLVVRHFELDLRHVQALSRKVGSRGETSAR